MTLIKDFFLERVSYLNITRTILIHCQKFYIKQIPLGQYYSSHDVSFHQFEMKFPDSVMIANHLLF